MNNHQATIKYSGRVLSVITEMLGELLIKVHKLKGGGKPVEAVLMNQVLGCNCELISSAMRPTVSRGQKEIHRNDCFLLPRLTELFC